MVDIFVHTKSIRAVSATFKPYQQEEGQSRGIEHVT